MTRTRSDLEAELLSQERARDEHSSAAKEIEEQISKVQAQLSSTSVFSVRKRALLKDQVSKLEHDRSSRETASRSAAAFVAKRREELSRHDEALDGCRKLGMHAEVPDKISDDPLVAAHRVTTWLLLPAGVPHTQEIVEEAIRVSGVSREKGHGWGAVVSPCSDPRSPHYGTSSVHERAKRRGLDVSVPCVFVDEVVDEFAYVTAQHAQLRTPAGLSEARWEDCGTTILDPLSAGEDVLLRVLAKVQGKVEVRLHEDEEEIGSSPLAPGLLSGADFRPSREGPHAYRIEARGKGSVDAVALSVVRRQVRRRK